MTEPAARSIHPALLAALEADRDSLNQRFRLCAFEGAPLDAQAFLDHIVTRIDKIVAAVHARFPERTRLVTNELYDVSLDLFRTGFFGTETRLAALDRLWIVILPNLAALVARAPQRVAGALSNALVNLAAHSTARSDQWLNELMRIGPMCQSENELLDVAGVLAWRAGMAHLRSGAVERLARLPVSLAAQAVGLETTPEASVWEDVRERIAQDRWFNPASAANGSATAGPTLVHVVGSFRGFGGSFMKPPHVVLHDESLHVLDESSIWRLHADCFGTHLQRIGPVTESGIPIKKRTGRKQAGATQPSISEDGTVTWAAEQSRFAHLASANSQAFDGQALAVTLSTSFHVYLIRMS